MHKVCDVKLAGVVRDRETQSVLLISRKAAVSDLDDPHALEHPPCSSTLALRPPKTPLNPTTSDLMTSTPLVYNHSCFPQIGWDYVCGKCRIVPFFFYPQPITSLNYSGHRVHKTKEKTK